MQFHSILQYNACSLSQLTASRACRSKAKLTLPRIPWKNPYGFRACRVGVSQPVEPPEVLQAPPPCHGGEQESSAGWGSVSRQV